MKCEKCGKEIKDGSDFCRFCGVKIVKETKTEKSSLYIPKNYVIFNLIAIAILLAGMLIEIFYVSITGLVSYGYIGIYFLWVIVNLWFLGYSFADVEKRQVQTLLPSVLDEAATRQKKN